MWKKLGPHIIMTADQQFLASAVLDMTSDGVGDDFEMLHGFIHHPALDVAGVIAAPSIATAATGQLVDEVELLEDGAVGNLKDARLGTIDQHHAGMLHAIEDRRQRLQVEALIENQVCFGQLRGQIELAPDALSGTGKNGLAMAAVVAQHFGHLKNALQVGKGGLLFASFLLRLAEHIVDQVLYEDGFVSMRTVGGRRGLIVKRYRAALRRVEICEFTDVISRDHSGSPG